MKKNLILHVGLQKTAASFLKEEVFSKIKNIDIIDYKKNPKLKSKYKKILISDETLSGELFSNEKKIRSKKFKNLAKVKIILVLRNQKDYLLSAYYFLVSKGVVFRTFDFWLKKNSSQKLINKLKFTNYINFYQKEFGKQNLLVLFYEDLLNNKDLFFSNMSKFIGEKIPTVKNKKVNYSIKSNFHLVLLIINFVNIYFFLFFKKVKLLNDKSFSFLVTRISRFYYSIFRDKKKTNNHKINIPFMNEIVADNKKLKKMLKKLPTNYKIK